MVDENSALDEDSGGDIDGVGQVFDWSQTPPSSAVVETVAAATDTEPTELDVIQYTIDADALDTLVGSVADPSELRVTFEYAGTTVVVTGTGTVRVVLG